MMESRNLTSLIAEFNMPPFELNILDKRRTMCEKIVSLIRFSFEDDAVAGVTSKVRHFYDLYFLMKGSECIEYLNSSFAQDLLDLIAQDKAEFDRPPLWKTSDINTSLLFADFKNLWEKVSPIYVSEVGNLSYGTIPTSEEIYNEISKLFGIVKKIIE